MDIIICANFGTALPAHVLYWISDLTSVYQAQAINWIELSDNFMVRVEEVAEKNIDKLYTKVKEREQQARCFGFHTPGHITKDCPDPNWVLNALTACTKAAEKSDTSDTPQEEEPSTAWMPSAPGNKCNLCKGQPQCTCQAITKSPDREPHSQSPEELAPIHRSIKDSQLVGSFSLDIRHCQISANFSIE